MNGWMPDIKSFFFHFQLLDNQLKGVLHVHNEWILIQGESDL